MYMYEPPIFLSNLLKNIIYTHTYMCIYIYTHPLTYKPLSFSPPTCSRTLPAAFGTVCVLSVCMYAYTYDILVRMYVCMYVRMYVQRALPNAFGPVYFTSVCICMCVCMRIHMYTCILVRMYVCMYVCTYV